MHNKENLSDSVSLDNFHKVRQSIQSLRHLLEGGVTVHPREAGASPGLQRVDVLLENSHSEEGGEGCYLRFGQSQNSPGQFLDALLVTKHGHNWNVAGDRLTQRSQNIRG